MGAQKPPSPLPTAVPKAGAEEENEKERIYNFLMLPMVGRASRFRTGSTVSPSIESESAVLCV
jgi:hypothetical protein